MSKKKKIVILSCMIALLAVTAALNFVLTTAPASSTEVAAVSSSNYFAQYRSERLTTRNEELLQLDSVISTAASESSERSEALKLKTELAKISEEELLVESLLKAYGFDDVVVVIGLDSDNVNVIAKSSELSADDAVTIYTVVAEELNATPENVKIIPIS